MIDLRRRNDRLRTAASMPAIVLRIAFIVFVAVVALLLVPITGWQVVVVVAAVLGVIVPQSFGGWISIAGVVVGMLMNDPSMWRAMAAVLAVHVIHVVASLLLVIPWRSRVVLAALWPSLRRLLLIQLIAQPLTLLVMLAFLSETVTVASAAIIGAGALATFVILFLLRTKRAEKRS
ncbi:hypothetical protein [Microbacterium sp. A84]|uniref:hypothetical protein n=1 Tax=Microbacterium sp. A84 TaxID=3450715 RepID=UPI003F43B479